MNRLGGRRWRPRQEAVAVGALIVIGVVVVVAGLIASIGGGRGPAGGWTAAEQASTSASNPATPSASGTFLLAQARTAPPIDLIDPDSRTFSLASLRGEQVLVFFGYTHCPDVCPATIGVIGQVLGAVGSGTRAVFVSVDPQRDTPAWLKEYVQFLPAGFTALTGTPDQIRSTADAWGVRYARIETDSPNGYAMSHTADVFLVDRAGEIRADFPFGTGKDAIVATIEAVTASTPATAPPPAASPTALESIAPSVASARQLTVSIVSTSVWAGPQSPVILSLGDESGRIDDASLRPTVQLLAAGGSQIGPAVAATPVRPPGLDRVSYVATLDIPNPGQWTLSASAEVGGSRVSGSAQLTALDPGTTAALGAPAPTAHTPTLNDAGGEARAVTTDPQPDLRLSMHSTTDALAAHTPFVLVIDSPKFRVSPVCGKAVIMARYLADRWPAVDFIDLEPFVYSLVSDTPVLSGDIADPPLSPVAAAWGIGGAPWGGLSMPWVFVVDGNGIVRAKYQGLMGSDDVDVLLALLSGDG